MSCFDVREVMELRPEIEKLGGEIKNDWYDLGGPFSLGEQTLVLFPNGYGASVISKEGSYGFDQGLMELGVIKWSGKDSKIRWDLVYDNPVIEDDAILGFLDKDGLLEKLEQISEIDPKEAE